jgi:hypothetical protein
MAPFPLPSWRWKEQIVPAVSSFTPSVPSTEVILTEPGHVRPPLPGLVTLAVAFRDTAAGSPRCQRPGSGCGASAQVGCHASRSMRPRICPKSRCVK